MIACNRDGPDQTRTRSSPAVRGESVCTASSSAPLRETRTISKAPRPRLSAVSERENCSSYDREWQLIAHATNRDDRAGKLEPRGREVLEQEQSILTDRRKGKDEPNATVGGRRRGYDAPAAARVPPPSQWRPAALSVCGPAGRWQQQSTDLGGGEQQADALHADLQQAALARSQVLHGKLAAQLESGCDPGPASRRPLHRLLDAVVQVPTLPAGTGVRSGSAARSIASLTQ